jgi:hypothetical protein
MSKHQTCTIGENIYAKPPYRSVPVLIDVSQRATDFEETHFEALSEAGTRIGGRNRAARPVQQLDPEALFKISYGVTECRGRHA